jgi:homoserine dehydrogenase
MIEIPTRSANVNDVFNAIFTALSLGDANAYGRGRGRAPTGRGVGDVMNLAFRQSEGFDRDNGFAINDRR